MATRELMHLLTSPKFIVADWASRGLVREWFLLGLVVSGGVTNLERGGFKLGDGFSAEAFVGGWRLADKVADH